MKKWIETIKKMKENPKEKAILFFGFYLLFFIAVILFVRFSSRNQTLSSDYEKGNSVVGQVGSLLSENYMYQYRIQMDDNESIIEGKRYQKKDSFVYRDQSYFCNNGSCYVKAEKWTECFHPIRYSSLFDPSNIQWILEHSYYESKTSYESGQVLYHYLVPTDTLNQVVLDEVTDLDLENNTITIKIDENQNLSSIVFQLDSFCKYNRMCNNRLKIDAEYSHLGELKEIENPIMN